MRQFIRRLFRFTYVPAAPPEPEEAPAREDDDTRNMKVPPRED